MHLIMNYKLILGIISPIIIIISLITFESLNTAFSIEGQYIDSIPYEKIFKPDVIEMFEIKLGDISIKNNYFFSRRYYLPVLGLCLIDDDNFKQPVNIGNMYAGSFSYSSSIYEKKTIEIKPGEELLIDVLFYPEYGVYNASEAWLKETYGDYETLIIYELKDSDYKKTWDGYGCYNIPDSIKSSAIKIPIKK